LLLIILNESVSIYCQSIKAREKLFEGHLATPMIMPTKDSRTITYLKGKVWNQSLSTFGYRSPNSTVSHLMKREINQNQCHHI